MVFRGFAGRSVGKHSKSDKVKETIKGRNLKTLIKLQLSVYRFFLQLGLVHLIITFGRVFLHTTRNDFLIFHIFI